MSAYESAAAAAKSHMNLGGHKYSVHGTWEMVKYSSHSLGREWRPQK